MGGSSQLNRTERQVENEDEGMRLSDGEKEEVREKFSTVNEQDEKDVREKFALKYGKVGDILLNSKFKAVRDLALNVSCLWEMLVDPDYTIEWRVKAGIIVALGYFISPIDAIPDAIPVVGYVDDALVAGYVVHLLSEDIVKYRAWREEQGRPLPTT